MKNLIIAGTYNIDRISGKVIYNVFLYGQTEETPGMQFIKNLYVEGSHRILSETARSEFTHFYKCDNYNIISSTNLTEV